jgi:CheY-like chemotaxis protein
VKLHDGTVEAHSDGAGTGSEFVVRLPAMEANDPARPVVGEPDPGQAAASSPEHRAGARRILVVDDTIDAADSLARFLTLQGHHVDVVHDGSTALDTALRDAHEVVFLDLDLPKMGGLEVARRLRTRYGAEQMLLVATTGFGQAEDERRTSEAGFDHHLTKPIDTSAVQALLTSSSKSYGDAEVVQ